MTSRIPSGHLGRLLGYSFWAAAFFGGAEGSARAQSTPRYMTSEEDVSELDVVKLKDRASVAFQLYSVVPSSRPFQAVQGSQVEAFRYQISGAFGAEFAYRLTTNMDLGLSVAYELFESRVEQGAASTEFSDARMKLFPVMAVARWQWPRTFWSPEAEVGLGLGIFNMTVDSTNLSQDTVTDSSTSLLAHAAGGLSLAWLDNTNLGVMLGYRYMMLGKKDFPASIFDIRRGSLSGVYAKATLRYHF